MLHVVLILFLNKTRLLIHLNFLIQTWGDAPKMAIREPSKETNASCAEEEDQIDDTEGVPSASNVDVAIPANETIMFQQRQKIFLIKAKYIDLTIG